MNEERGIAHFIVIILVMLGIVIGAYLVKNPQIFSPKANSGNICRASDPNSFSNCINSLNSAQISTIEVVGQIRCQGSRDCDFPNITSTQPSLITGKNGAGFIWSGDYSYNLLKLNNARNVIISNLTFDAVSPDSCGEGCNHSLVTIFSGSDITFDNNIFKNSKYMGIAVHKAKNITVKNSEFYNNGWFGLWTDTAESILVDNNLFQDTLSNAILGNFSGTPERPSIIRNNSFIHNHRHVIFFVCGGDDGACPGGQVDITSPTNNLVIEGNIIKDGKIDQYHGRGLHAAGIELNGDTTNLVIKNNLIKSNSGSGIALNSGSGNISFKIQDNVIIENGDGSGLSDSFASFLSSNCVSGCVTPPNLGYKKVAQNSQISQQITPAVPQDVQIVAPLNTPVTIPTSSVQIAPVPNPQESTGGSVLTIPKDAITQSSSSPSEIRALPSSDKDPASPSPRKQNPEPLLQQSPLITKAVPQVPASPISTSIPAVVSPSVQTPAATPEPPLTPPSSLLGDVINAFKGIGDTLGYTFTSLLRGVGINL